MNIHRIFNYRKFCLSTFRNISIFKTQSYKKMENSFTKRYIPGVIPEIELTPTESQIINVLNNYTTAYNSTLESEQSPITLRITGGWVRDKLLGLPSHDIDIGIDNCSGESFVMGLKEWLEEEKKGTDETINKIHKIKKNPDKSKHLETCTTKLFGLDIDFVNLRSESYTDNSRIPTISTGTPYEDSHRRDATLNALFFNLSTKKIEDLTNKGLEDLANGVLRTPLDPMKTFLDDPLRCLRLIRFASNYGFSIDRLAIEAMKQSEIKVALETKISRERIGVEVKKMIINKRGIIGVNDSIELLKEVGFSCVFDVGDSKVGDEWMKENDKLLNEDIMKNFDNINKYLIPIVESKIINFKGFLNEECDENDRVLFYSCLILNTWRDKRIKIGKKDFYVSYLCELNGIKMPAKISENVSNIVKNIENVRNDIKNVSNFKRSEIALKFILPFNDKWGYNLIINCCLEIFENEGNEMISIIEKYKDVFNIIYELKLENSYNESILLNGKELMKIINRKPGPWLKPLNDKLFLWQLDNPGKNKEDMIEYLSSIEIN